MSVLSLTLLLLAVLYFLAATFACIETAFTSASRAWLRELAEQGNKKAALAKKLLENAGGFFGTVLMGTNLLHVSITTLVRSVIAATIVNSQWFISLAATLGIDTDSENMVTSAIVTPTLLLFTELVPKAIGRNHADKLTLSLAKPLDFFTLLLKLPVSAIDFFSARLARALGTSKDGHGIGNVSREDLKILAAVAAEQGLIRKEAEQIMTSLLELDNKPIETIMIPLVDVKSLPITATVEDVEKLAAETGFTRFPVYKGRVDEVVGLISLRRCMYQMPMHSDDNSIAENAKRPIKDLVDPNVLFIPESKTVGSLFSDLRKGRSPMMVVVDEYGGVVGTVTMEDLLSLLVGGIQDIRNQETSMIKKTGEGSFECDGKTDIRDIEPWLGFKIDNQGYETAAGLTLKLMGCIPRKEASIDFHGYTIQVLDVQKHKILKLKFTKNK